ncbi:MAG: lamin tail domain-containing protein [Bacteroidota bacterium]
MKHILPSVISLFFFMIISLLGSMAQVSDDFSDGDLTNAPSWQGETSLWTIDNGELRTNGTMADEAHLVTANTMIDQTEWRIRMRYTGGGPSTSNRIRFYLVSDQADLEGALNGYFVQVGETGSLDSYDLYRQSGSTITKIIDGIDGLAGSNVNATLKVTRDNLGNWELLVDQGNQGLFSSQGTTQDAQFTTTSFVGMWTKFSSTRTQSFFYDDLYVGVPIVDSDPPILQSIDPLSATQIDLVFNEALQQNTAETNSNYVINAGIGSPSSSILDGNDPRLVHLTLANPLQNNTNYTLNINGISDLAGNAILPLSENFSYIVPSTAIFKDVIINEIMADPSPVVGLPSAEYLELYNRASHSFDLSNWTIDNGTTTGTLPSFTLNPGQYVLLVRNTDQALFATIPDVISPSSWTSLVNGGDNVGLRSADGTLIDTVDYELAWYRDAVKDNGGHSLELINPDLLDCAPATNWIASINANGGTPGGQNSVFSTAPDQSLPSLLSANVIGTDTIELCFSEGMNAATIDQVSSYSLDNGVGTPQAAIPLSPDFQCVKLVFAGTIQVGVPYVLTVSQVEDCGGNVLVTDSIALAKGLEATAGDIVISELYPDFEPSQGLPESEFIELYNRTNSVLDVSSFSITDGTSTVGLPNAVMFPGEYVILCSLADTSTWNDYGRVIPVSTLPSLNNSTDSIRLLGPFLEDIDYVFYSSEWYQDAGKAQGGFTLERIDTDLIDCNNPGNWRASNGRLGGTPGEINSINGTFEDKEAPEVVSALVSAPDRILLRFNEPLAPSPVFLEENFSIDNGIGTPTRSLVSATDNTQATLELGSPLQANTVYQLTILNLTDCVGNLLQTNIQLGLPQNASPFEVIFTELLPDPSPALGLAEVEYIEIFNRSQNILNLATLSLEVSGTITELPEGLLLPGEFVALVDEDDITEFVGQGKTVAVDGLPSLRNSSDTLFLYGAGGSLIDYLYYQDDWYDDLAKSEGGYSLERIDNNYIDCVNPENWKASKDPSGGTPGLANSISGTFSDNVPPVISALRPVNSSELIIEFSKQMEGDQLEVLQSYSVNNNIGSPVLALTEGPFFREVRLVFDQAFLPQTIYELSFENISDCGGNALQEIIQFGLPEQPVAGDILINEILFNPITGGNDFVEIINVSEKVLDLSSVSIGEIFPDTDSIFNADPISERIALILPNQIICLTNNVAIQQQTYLPPLDANFLEMTSFPSYDDSKGECILFTVSDTLDRFFYEDDYHYLTLTDDDGISLERLSLSVPTNEPSNWQSAASTVGYATPGYQNSQFVVENPQEGEVYLENPTFSPNLDGVDDNLSIRYNFDFPGSNMRILIFDANGRMIRTLQQNTLLSPEEGVIFWDGFDDRNTKAAVGMYVVLVDVLNADTGERKLYRNVAVLADNF